MAWSQLKDRAVFGIPSSSPVPTPDGYRDHLLRCMMVHMHRYPPCSLGTVHPCPGTPIHLGFGDTLSLASRHPPQYIYYKDYPITCSIFADNHLSPGLGAAALTLTAQTCPLPELAAGFLGPWNSPALLGPSSLACSPAQPGLCTHSSPRRVLLACFPSPRYLLSPFVGFVGLLRLLRACPGWAEDKALEEGRGKHRTLGR